MTILGSEATMGEVTVQGSLVVASAIVLFLMAFISGFISGRK